MRGLLKLPGAVAVAEAEAAGCPCPCRSSAARSPSPLAQSLCSKHLRLPLDAILPPIPGLDGPGGAAQHAPNLLNKHLEPPRPDCGHSHPYFSSAADEQLLMGHAASIRQQEEAMHSHPYFVQATPEQKQAGKQAAERAEVEARQHPYFKLVGLQPASLPGPAPCSEATARASLQPEGRTQ